MVMKPSVRNAAILVLLAVLLTGIKIAISVTHQPSDDKQIQQALTESLDASRKGESGGVLGLLSRQLKVNQDSAPESGQIAKFIRDSRPDITILDRRTLITGDEARMVSPVDLKLEFLGQSFSQRLDNVTLVFHREEARGFLFLPTTKWRLTEVRLSENQVPSFAG
jgi:hypothetical protein